MTLRHKLFTCLATLALVIGAVTTLSLWEFQTSRDALDTILKDRVVPMRDLKIVADKYAVDIVDASHKANNGNASFPESIRTVEAGSASLKRAWKNYRATRIDGEEERLARQAEAKMVAADRSVAQLKQILQRGDQPALDSFVRNDLYQTVDPVSESIGKLVDLQLKIAEQTAEEAAASALLSRNIMLGLVALAIVVLIMSFVIISSKVVAPIRRLAVTIADMANATGTATVPHQDQKDEIGDIARSVETFRQSVVATEREKAVAAAEATRSLGEGLSALAKGDLTFQLQGHFPEAYRQLQIDFNEAAGSLRNTVAQVNEAANDINYGVADIRQASDDLSQRTERQAASLEETAAALAELTGTVANSATKTKSASDSMRSARDEAQQSGETVRRAVEAMSGIERTSAEITEIISVIDGIAFQTNLLALNAGVEAARAGEAGKGFAVVASEVRALAQRATEAASDVKTRIAASSDQVESGVELVGATGRALNTIIQRIEEVDTLIDDIAGSATQQATGLKQINSAVGEMDVVTQQNAAMVEEATAATRSLADKVNSMMGQIERFHVGGEKGSNKVKMAKGAGYAPAYRASAVASAPALQVVGNTALKSDPDDWSEF